MYQARRPAVQQSANLFAGDPGLAASGRRSHQHIFEFERRQSFQLKRVRFEWTDRRVTDVGQKTPHLTRLSEAREWLLAHLSDGWLGGVRRAPLSFCFLRRLSPAGTSIARSNHALILTHGCLFRRAARIQPKQKTTPFKNLRKKKKEKIQPQPPPQNNKKKKRSSKEERG